MQFTRVSRWKIANGCFRQIHCALFVLTPCELLNGVSLQLCSKYRHIRSIIRQVMRSLMRCVCSNALILMYLLFCGCHGFFCWRDDDIRCAVSEFFPPSLNNANYLRVGDTCYTRGGWVPTNHRIERQSVKRKTYNNHNFDKLAPELFDAKFIIRITFPDKPGEVSKQVIIFKIWPRMEYLCFSFIIIII